MAQAEPAALFGVSFGSSSEAVSVPGFTLFVLFISPGFQNFLLL